MITNTNGSLVLQGFEFKARAPEVLAEFPVIQQPHFEEVVRIRAYQPSDRERICQLCCDTGFLGRPVDALFQDRQLFADLFTKPYLDYESDWILVAETDGRLVGYLLGSVRPRFDLLQVWKWFQDLRPDGDAARRRPICKARAKPSVSSLAIHPRILGTAEAPRQRRAFASRHHQTISREGNRAQVVGALRAQIARSGRCRVLRRIFLVSEAPAGIRLCPLWLQRF